MKQREVDQSPRMLPFFSGSSCRAFKAVTVRRWANVTCEADLNIFLRNRFKSCEDGDLRTAKR